MMSKNILSLCQTLMEIYNAKPLIKGFRSITTWIQGRTLIHTIEHRHHSTRITNAWIERLATLKITAASYTKTWFEANNVVYLKTSTTRDESYIGMTTQGIVKKKPIDLGKSANSIEACSSAANRH